MSEFSSVRKRTAAANPYSSLGSSYQRQEAKRIEKMCEALAQHEKVPPWAQNLLQQLAPLLGMLAQLLDTVGPYITQFFMMCYTVYDMLPGHIITALYGVGLCFFGGSFPSAIAALETFRISGGDRVMSCLRDLWTDFLAVREANKEDDKKDDDGDGVADVDQVSKKELLTRKIGMVLRSVNPDRIMTALGGLAQAFSGVLVILKVQFARTISLAVSISDMLHKPARLLLAKPLATLIPPDYHHWIMPVLDIACKSIAFSIAWFIQRIISACHSAALGGLLAARHLLKFANERNLIQIEEADTLIDEAAGWLLAGVGLYFQLSNFMQLPFWLSVLLFPLSALETVLQWAVTWSK
mmetsp:Transcript_13582/g.31924  ORF Transcript_13582/g.31924 Transcript_13582/m.31924 type:complete len:354 (-) Transcript_13582:266-1327(-)